MGDLFCCVRFLCHCDNVVTTVVQGADDTQPVVERVVGAEVQFQVLVGVSGIVVYLYSCVSITIAALPLSTVCEEVMLIDIVWRN